MYCGGSRNMILYIVCYCISFHDWRRCYLIRKYMSVFSMVLGNFRRCCSLTSTWWWCGTNSRTTRRFCFSDGDSIQQYDRFRLHWWFRIICIIPLTATCGYRTCSIRQVDVGGLVNDVIRFNRSCCRWYSTSVIVNFSRFGRIQCKIRLWSMSQGHHTVASILISSTCVWLYGFLMVCWP